MLLDLKTRSGYVNYMIRKRKDNKCHICGSQLKPIFHKEGKYKGEIELYCESCEKGWFLREGGTKLIEKW